MIANVLAEPHLALGPLWAGYIILIHATAYVVGVGLLYPFVRHAGPELRAHLHAGGAIGMLAVSLLGWLPSGWWAWLVPAGVAAPLVDIGAAMMAQAETPGARDVRGFALVFVAWIAGTLFLLLRLAVGWLSVALLSRRARPLEGADWQRALREAHASIDTGRMVELRISAAVEAPLAWGIFNPVILLPAEAADWSAETRRMVLLHELAHIERDDNLLQLLAQLAAAWYWFHPGVWWSIRGFRAAREEACDARVVAAGVRRSDYAACLVALADSVRAERAGAVATAMAGRALLTNRLRCLLKHPPTADTSRWIPRGVLGACAVWAIMVGLIRLVAQPEVLFEALESTDWARRSYAASVLSTSSSREIRARLSASAAHDPHPTVRRLATPDD